MGEVIANSSIIVFMMENSKTGISKAKVFIMGLIIGINVMYTMENGSLAYEKAEEFINQLILWKGHGFPGLMASNLIICRRVIMNMMENGRLTYLTAEEL